MIVNKITYNIDFLLKNYADVAHLLVARLASSHSNSEKQFVLNGDKKILKQIIKFLIFGIMGVSKKYREKISESRIIYIGCPKKLKRELKDLRDRYPRAAFIANEKEKNTEAFSEIGQSIFLNNYKFRLFDIRIISFTLRIIIKVLTGIIKDRSRLREHIYVLTAIGYYQLELALIDSIRPNKSSKILNLFAGTQEGAIINYIFKINCGEVFTYSWGSNVASLEQKYVISDHYLLKDGDPIDLYCAKKSKYISEIGRVVIVKGNIKYDCCIIDTCETDRFDVRQKIKVLDELNLMDLSVVYAWHPGTVNREMIKRVFHNFEYSENTIEAICSSEIIIDFHSTLQSILDNSEIRFISLARYIYTYIYNKNSPGYFERDMAFSPTVLSSCIEEFRCLRYGNNASKSNYASNFDISEIF